MNTQMMEMMSMTMPAADMAMMQECIESCAAAEQVCTMCADSASGAEAMAMGSGKMMAMCLNVADMASTMMRMLMRPMGHDMATTMKMLEATMLACRACAMPAKQASEMSESAKMCAQVCMNCADACEALMHSMAMAH